MSEDIARPDRVFELHQPLAVQVYEYGAWRDGDGVAYKEVRRQIWVFVSFTAPTGLQQTGWYPEDEIRLRGNQ